MIDAERSDKLLRFFGNMLAFYQDFLTFERDKYNIIASGELEKLDEALKQEQAFTLKARGLEIERKKLLEEAGAAQYTFRELIPQVELSRQEPMKKLYSDISATVADVRQVNERCSRMTHLKMGRVSQILSKIEDHPELKQIYKSNLQNPAGGEGSFSRKV